MNCVFCGTELTRRTQKKYCSISCQQADRSRQAALRNTRVCQQCGKEFVMVRGSLGLFCSRKCRGKARSEYAMNNPKPEKQLKLAKYCKICGIEIARWKGAYCGDECRKAKARQDGYKSSKAKKVLKARPCKECGAMFTPEYGNKKRCFCSEFCCHKNVRRRRKQKERARMHGAKVENVNAMEVFARDGWRCQICMKKLKKKDRGTHKDAAPELDHIVPLCVGGEHSYRNTQCVCRKCNGDKGARVIGQLRMFG